MKPTSLGLAGRIAAAFLHSRLTPLAILTFNRPEARNAMTWGMYDALVEACERVDGDGSIRVFVLRGAGGKAFAAGTDISQFQQFQTPQDGVDPVEALRLATEAHRIADSTLLSARDLAAAHDPLDVAGGLQHLRRRIEARDVEPAEGRRQGFRQLARAAAEIEDAAG